MIQPESVLFGKEIMDTADETYQAERESQLERAKAKLVDVLKQNPNGVKYEALLGVVLETPMVWESDLKSWLSELRSDGSIHIPEPTGGKRTPQVGHTIIPQ